MGLRILVSLIIVSLAQQTFCSKKLELLYKWKELDYEFTSSSMKERMIRNQEFIPGNPVPIDVDTWQNDNDERVFLTIPKFKDGIPASLVTVSDRKNGESHLLKPYPDWSWHNGDCDGLTSVFRTQIDKCGRLWVIDSGMVDLFKSPRRRQCQPQLLAFSLSSDKLSQRYRFPDNVLSEGSILATVAIDVRDQNNRCSDTFAYVADVTGFSVVVYDVKNDKSWRVQSNTMYPYPPQGVFQTNNAEFDLMDGILGLALGPLKNGDRDLYYHAFASVKESWVPTSVLKNESIYSTGFNTAPREFKTSEGVRSSQAAPEAFDKNGILYFSPVSDNAIHCWNHQTPYALHNIHEVARDNSNLQFTTGLKVVQTENDEEEIWALSTRFHLVMVDRMNRNEVNFRVMKGKLSELTNGSPCHRNRPITFPQYSHGQNHGHGQHGHSYSHGHREKPSSYNRPISGYTLF